MWVVSHTPKSKRLSSAYGPREHHHPTGNVTTIGIGRREFIATLGRYLCSVGVPMQHSQLFFPSNPTSMTCAHASPRVLCKREAKSSKWLENTAASMAVWRDYDTGRRRALNGQCTQFSRDAAVPAGGKKERDAAGHVGLDLCSQVFELLAEQGAYENWPDNQIDKKSRCRWQSPRRERRQAAVRFGLGGFGQEVAHNLLAAPARRGVVSDAR